MTSKALPRSISGTDLAKRQEIVERGQALEATREQLEQALAQNQRELAEHQGAWRFWRREVIDPRYGMADGDAIGDDGTIIRAPKGGDNGTNGRPVRS